MTPEVDELSEGPDPVWRSTFLLCFRRSLAEDAEILGHWLSDVMYEAGSLQEALNTKSSLRGVARDLYHLERFVAAVRLDLGAARRSLPCFVKLIRAAFHRIRMPDRAPALRETFLLRLPKDVQRPARTLGVYLQATLGDSRAQQQPLRARQGVIAELGFLVAYLRDVAQDSDACDESDRERHLGRFAGRMADRLEQLAQSMGQTEEP